MTSRKDKGMTVLEKSVQELFNGRSLFEVPYFQRSYVWGKEQWERFIDDMEKISEEDKGYFMGFIILKKKNLYSDTPSNSVVDGQQRLTTFLIFAKVMCEFNENNEGKINFEEEEEEEIIFYHNYNDRHIFEPILKGEPLTEKTRDAYENNKVLKCYDYFRSDKQKEKIGNIDFDKVIRNLFFICMFLTPDDDEQQTFDTMNSLGILLTTSELLKNQLFTAEQEDLFKNTWKEVFEKDVDTTDYWSEKIAVARLLRTYIDLLLQNFLFIKESEHKETQKTGGYFRRYKHILETHYSNENQKEEFINELIEYAQVYRDNIKPESIDMPLDGSYITQRINLIMFGLEITTIIPYVIYILKKVEDVEEQKKIFKLMETYLMRRIIVGESNKVHSSLFMAHIRDKKASYELLANDIFNDQSSYPTMPSDQQIAEAFKNETFTNKRAKAILYFLELHARSGKNTTELFEFKNYSVEHIMPRKWKDNWQHNLPEGNATEQEEIRDNMIFTLGNLTLLKPSLNSALKNASWKDKRDGKRGKKILKGFKDYCKDIETFSGYFEDDDWNEETIKKRSDELLEHAKNLWPYSR